ncbi:Protein transport protein S9 plasma membrane t-SNARE [Emydomyces testavorans]|uniref:Protein transport protein SEC9 n=1 Tax=Emydomyces testavorans TaxID=2070801 RepID=A0AAF0DLB1_9EURO|nr:Protein transport protein S9 plasma membrane t-SNARE [Emydomyces testavorans]
MKKLGFNKKSEDGDDDSSRKALFGSKAKSKSPAPSSNPYAQAPAYTDPYTEAKSKIYGPPQAQAANGGLPTGPKQRYGGMNQSPNQMGNAGKNPYGEANGGGYGPGRQGDQGGYGSDRYGGGNTTGGGSRYGPGGYGGLGNTDPNAADDNRNALFGDARQRFQERQQQHDNSHPPPYSAHAGGQNESGAPGTTSGGYGAYQERQLTAEEEEEEDVQAMKQEIRFMKQQDVSSTRNALRVAAEAEETGRSTLARLGAQGERIHNTEKNLDLAANQNRIADEKSRELKRLNKSMFAMHVSNPFTSAERRKARDDAIIDRHQEERLQREETRLAAFRTEQRLGQTFKEMGKSTAPQKKTNLAERSKYQFEQDSEDDEMENEIESNLDALHGAAVRLNGLARATGRELEEQNKRLDVITGKSDSVDDQIHMNRARLDRIH